MKNLKIYIQENDLKLLPTNAKMTKGRLISKKKHSKVIKFTINWQKGKASIDKEVVDLGFENRRELANHPNCLWYDKMEGLKTLTKKAMMYGESFCINLKKDEWIFVLKLVLRNRLEGKIVYISDWIIDAKTSVFYNKKYIGNFYDMYCPANAERVSHVILNMKIKYFYRKGRDILTEGFYLRWYGSTVYINEIPVNNKYMKFVNYILKEKKVKIKYRPIDFTRDNVICWMGRNFIHICEFINGSVNYKSERLIETYIDPLSERILKNKVKIVSDEVFNQLVEGASFLYPITSYKKIPVHMKLLKNYKGDYILNGESIPGIIIEHKLIEL